jgi:hypothetical protein
LSKFTPYTVWVGSSVLPGGFKVQWHTLSRWFANVEIYICLFVAFRVLLSPQNQQKRRKFRKDNLRPVDLRMTSCTESDHEMQPRLARFPMMHSGIGITAYPTGVSIALQDLLAQAAEILGILPFQRVAGRTEAQGEDLFIPAGTANCGLDPLLQSPIPSSSVWSRFRG